MRVTSEECTLPTIRNWHTTPLTAPRPRPHPARPHSAAYAISTAQIYHPNVWSNSSSGIGSASTPALCSNRSCPASALRIAVWSNSSSGIASNTASGAASRCGLLSPYSCSLPLWRAALRSSQIPPPGSDSPHQRSKSSASASEIPPPTATRPLPATHAPPCAQPSPPYAVCCSPDTPRALARISNQ